MLHNSERSDKGTIVYIGGLLGDVKKEDLEREFETFGKLTRVWVAFNPPGFAFVEFLNKEDAENAVKALHNTTVLGSKVRVEISRGRGRGGSRGGMPGRGGFRGEMDRPRGGGGFAPRGRGAPRGGHGDFRGRGRGGFGPGFGRDEGLKPFRGGDAEGRFDDYDFKRRAEFQQREFGGPRDYESRRGFRDVESARGFVDMRDDGRDFPSRDVPRDFGARDLGGRDFQGRDFAPRDLSGRDYPPRDFPSREVGGGRDYDPRDVGNRGFGVERELNGARGFGGGLRDGPAVRDAGPLVRDGGLIERGYAGGGRSLGGVRDFGDREAPAGPRDFGVSRDIPPIRDAGLARDFGPRSNLPERDYPSVRDVGVRRDAPPRDLGGDYGGRPARSDYLAGANPRGGYGNSDVRRGPNYDDGRFAGGNINATAGYGDFGARDRFRSRSPIGRGRYTGLYKIGINFIS